MTPRGDKCKMIIPRTNAPIIRIEKQGMQQHTLSFISRSVLR